MSTKTKTESTNQYDPGSKSAFDKMTPQAQGVLSSYMSDPFNKNGGNPFYNLSLQSGLKANSLMNQNMLSNLTRNMSARGFGGGNMPGFMQSQLATAGRNASAMNSNTFMQNAFNAQNLQMQATNAGLNYKPLQTGQTQTQTQSGLGTWLPQVVGAGLQAGAAFATGGASLGMKAAMAGASAGGSLMSNMTKPAMSSGLSYGGYTGQGNPQLSWLQMPSNPAAMGNPFLMNSGGH